MKQSIELATRRRGLLRAEPRPDIPFDDQGAFVREPHRVDRGARGARQSTDGYNSGATMPADPVPHRRRHTYPVQLLRKLRLLSAVRMLPLARGYAPDEAGR